MCSEGQVDYTHFQEGFIDVSSPKIEEHLCHKTKQHLLNESIITVGAEEDTSGGQGNQ